MKNNKFISVLLALSLSIIPLLTSSVSAASEYDNTVEVLELLKRLEIITVDDNYNAEADITRAEYLSMLLRALESDKLYNGSEKQIFFDVPIDSPYAADVLTAWELGIIKGHADGRFCPDSSITFDEAVTMTVRAMGCEQLSQLGGGYYAGYFASAMESGLLDNIDPEEIVSRRLAAELVYNMLTAGIMSSVDGEKWEINYDSSLLEERFGIINDIGIVDATSMANLYGGSKTASNHISIDGSVYNIASEFDGMYAGMRVSYYYEYDKASNEVGDIIYICPEKNTVTEINAEDVVSLATGALEYYTENDRLRKLNLSDKVITLDNGEKINVPDKGIDLPKYGNFTVIDNNTDGRADVVLISSYDIGIIKSISEETIYFGNTKPFNINCEDYERVIIKDKNGTDITLADLKAGSVANIYKAADKSYVEMIISTDTVTITVTSLAEESNVYVYYIVGDASGKEYRTIRDFGNIYSKNKLITGSSYNAALDVNGYIAALIDGTENESVKYGYLYKWFDAGDPGDEQITLKIFTQEGVFESIRVAERISNPATGTSMSDKELLSACTERQVIRYGVNPQGMINRVEFASADPFSAGFKKGGATSTSRDGLSRYYTATQLIGGTIAVDKQTVVFIIPGADNIEQENMYSVGTSELLVDEKYYPNSQAYVIGDDIYSKVVTTVSNSTAVVRDSSRMLVSNVKVVYDEAEGINKKVLSGWEDGKEKTLNLLDESVLKYTTTDDVELTVGEGDVIRYETNAKGEISYIKLVFDYDAKTLYGTNDGNDDSVKYGSDVVHTYGAVSRKKDKYLYVIRNGQTDESPYMYPITTATYIYEYDSEENRSLRIKSITENDIITLEDDPDSTNKLVMITRQGTVPFIVIYK